MLKIILPFLALLGLFICASPTDSGQHASIEVLENHTNSRRQLARTFRQAQGVQFIYGASDSASAQLYRGLIDSIRSDIPDNWTIRIAAASEYPAEQPGDLPLVMIGHHFPQEGWMDLLKQLPIQWRRRGFTWQDETFNQSEQSFRIFLYPHPRQDTLPTFYLLGNTPEAVVQQFYQSAARSGWGFFWGSWGFEIFDGDQALVRGYLDETTWAIDPERQFDLRRPDEQIHRSEHFTFHDLAGRGETFLQQLATDCEQQLHNLRTFTGSDRQIAPIDYYLYPSIEYKGLRLLNTDEGQAQLSQRQIHLVINEPFRGQHSEHDLRLLLHDLLGPADHPVLATGLAVHFKPEWQEKGAKYWAARLYQSDNLPALQELLNRDWFQQESPLVTTAAAGALVDFLLGHWGKAKLLRSYTRWPKLQEGELIQLEAAWHTALAQYPLSPAGPAQQLLPYYRGFNFAHEGYQIYNGYGSELAVASLQHLQQLGTNAIAIIPYGYLRQPNQPRFPGVHHRAGSENDEAVIFAHHRAQQLGISTLLKPQIWISNSWPGDVDMPTESDWQQFYDDYYRWIRHYALLAEMRGFDAFCIGVEFSKSTLQHPDRWRDMIRRVRGLYRGPITYAANWGAEFEQLTFWDALDFIGLNSYYPLSQSDSPNRNELKKAMEQVLEKARRVNRTFNKPVVLTEVGFRSVDTPWKNPHADADGRAYNPDAQQLCYEVLFECIQNKDWIKGLFLWKWPSYLDYQRTHPHGFAPAGKPAEQVVARWYGGSLQE